MSSTPADIESMKSRFNEVGRLLNEKAAELTESNRDTVLPEINKLKAEFDDLFAKIVEAQKKGGQRKSRKRITRKKRTTRRR